MMKRRSFGLFNGAEITLIRVLSIALVALGLVIHPLSSAQGRQITPLHQGPLQDCQKWKEDVTITKTTHEEDIRDTLKSIATANDTPITFGEGLNFKVTVQFQKTPLKSAFQSIIDNYGLAYFWDACSIHVFNPEMRKTRDVLIQLERLPVEEVKDALQRFGLLKKEVKVVFDPLTNTILLTGTDREINNIQEVITVLESARLRKGRIRPETRYYPLTYAKVDDTEITVGKRTVTVKGLVSVLTEVLHLTRLGERREIEVVAEPGKKENMNPREYGAVSGELVSQAQVVKKMIQAEAGTIASDSRTNQIIIRDYPDKLDEYGLIIKQLDRPTRMVKISIIIVEASKDFARELGVGFGGSFEKSDRRRSYFGTSGSARDVINDVRGGVSPDTSSLIPLLDSAAGSSISPFGLAGTFLYLGNETALAATLAAAETKGLSRTINKSSIITMDNMQAIVQAKRIVNFKIQTGGTNPVVESREIDAGLELRVTPHIIKAEKTMIELMVEAQRSTFLNQFTDDIPERATTDLSTQAVVGDSGTVVVGGVFDSRYAVGETGIPCLMNIPGLGYLFKTASATHPKSNVLFFLTPQVISLEKIPYEGTELKKKVERYEEELRTIDPEKDQKLIEKNQDF
jgi:type III secretion protein C